MMTAFDLAGFKIHQSLMWIVWKSRYICCFAATRMEDFTGQFTPTRKGLSRLPGRLHYADNNMMDTV